MIKHRMYNKVSIASCLALIGVVATGCATNPATGKSQIMLVSEQQEIEMGRREDRNATRAFGVYNDPELQAYVRELKRRVFSS